MKNNDSRPSEEQQFLIALTRIGYQCGASLNRLNATLQQLGGCLGLSVDMSSNGSRAHMIFGPDAGDEAETDQRSYFLKLPEPMPELNKLVCVQELVDDVDSGRTSPADGLERIAEISKLPPLYGVGVTYLAFALIGAAVAVMFSSPWVDVFLGGVMGLVAFALVMLAGRYPWVARARVFLTGLVPAVLASILASTLFAGSNPFVLIISAIAVDIPGVILMLGFSEILLQQTVSGINRLVIGIVVVLQLFAGAAIGLALADHLLAVPEPAAAVPAQPFVLWGFIALLIFAAGLIFQVRPKHFLWVLVVGMITYLSMTAGKQLGFWQGPLVGAFALGVTSNIFARATKLPATLVSFPGMLSLMPGVLAYLGLFDATKAGPEHMLTVAWQLIITFVAIVAGVVVANTIVAPRVRL